jgi:hypothetical protein
MPPQCCGQYGPHRHAEKIVSSQRLSAPPEAGQERPPSENAVTIAHEKSSAPDLKRRVPGKLAKNSSDEDHAPLVAYHGAIRRPATYFTNKGRPRQVLADAFIAGLLQLLTAALVQVFGRRDDGLSTCSGGRRPKSAKARNRGGR